jgi:hypothetical protein
MLVWDGSGFFRVFYSFFSLLSLSLFSMLLKQFPSFFVFSTLRLDVKESQKNTCGRCCKAFRTPYHLQRHNRGSRKFCVKSPERSVLCPKGCGVRFEKRSSCARHSRTCYARDRATVCELERIAAQEKVCDLCCSFFTMFQSPRIGCYIFCSEY